MTLDSWSKTVQARFFLRVWMRHAVSAVGQPALALTGTVHALAIAMLQRQNARQVEVKLWSEGGTKTMKPCMVWSTQACVICHMSYYVSASDPSEKVPFSKAQQALAAFRCRGPPNPQLRNQNESRWELRSWDSSAFGAFGRRPSARSGDDSKKWLSQAPPPLSSFPNPFIKIS